MSKETNFLTNLPMYVYTCHGNPGLGWTILLYSRQLRARSFWSNEYLWYIRSTVTGNAFVFELKHEC